MLESSIVFVIIIFSVLKHFSYRELTIYALDAVIDFYPKELKLALTYIKKTEDLRILSGQPHKKVRIFLL